MQPCSFELGQMKMNTCKFAHYVKYWDACASTLHEQFRSLCVLFFYFLSDFRTALFAFCLPVFVERFRLPSRCVCCVQCGSNSPGFHCEWQNNYTHCGPCASLVTCPVCRENFMEEELLLQCQYCDRWVSSFQNHNCTDKM